MMKNLKNKRGLNVVLGLFLMSIFFGCKNNAKTKKAKEGEKPKPEMVNAPKIFGKTKKGKEIEEYTLSNKNKMAVTIITYGGRIKSLKVPDKNGEVKNVVIGFDSLKNYLGDNPFFGALIGRYGNRIAKGKFKLDGKEYQLALNDGENSLHGGNKGFDRVVWTVEKKPSQDQNRLVLNYVSKDMEEGYPGNLNVTVTYTLNDDNSLAIEYEAKTDKKTVLNLTNHSYFNLSGNFSKNVLDQQIKINADKFVPINKTLIPTGKLREVSGTPFDFRKPKPIGKEINSANKQLKLAGGYDHCWVLNKKENETGFAASAYDSATGIMLKVFTDQPGIQFYTGNFLDGTLPQRGGTGTYGKRSAFCLETEHFPDSPNQPQFPSVVLNPGEKYHSKTTFKFAVK